jgi:uncharacterized membrane protein YccC
MAELPERTWLGINHREAVHAVRTAVAAVTSLLVARLLRLPEAYWASITTLIVMQSTLGAAWTISKQRLAGTALGAAAGALLASYSDQNVVAYGAGLLVLGVVCAASRMQRNAYRYAGITLAIVMLVARAGPGWIIALHRFIEISVGIAVGLAITAIWPEAAAPP